MTSKNFALIGAAGYIAPRHMQAIRDTGNQLVAAVDPHDCVGAMDSYFPQAQFFTEIERFDRHLEKLRRKNSGREVQYVSICSPNYLHDAHVRLALRIRAHAICEKPLVLSPWNLEALQELEGEFDRRVFSVLQLRLLPSLIELRETLAKQAPHEKADICLTYITRRGQWYDVSWKGDKDKSGGVAMNIGIHFFDLMLWLFGPAESSQLHIHQDRKMAGVLELERARVRWFLSTDEQDLPLECRQAGKYAHRSMTLDGQEIEFSRGFTDLHTQVYNEILEGRGTGLTDAYPAIKLVHGINQSETAVHPQHAHPFVSRGLEAPLPQTKAA